VQGNTESEEAETYLNGEVKDVNYIKILNAGQHYFNIFNFISCVFFFKLMLDSLWAGRSGFQTRLGRDIPYPSRPALGPTQLPVQWVPAVKQPGRGIDHAPHIAPR